MGQGSLGRLQRLAIAPGQIHQGQVYLTAEQKHYLLQVLRLQAGDAFIAMDGQGACWRALLDRVDNATGAVLQATLADSVAMETELPVPVTLIAALPKGNGFDQVLRHSVELGVAAIAPAISERTLLSPSPQKRLRWQRIAREAAEQSERTTVPAVLEPEPFAACLQNWQSVPLRYLCVARGAAPHLWPCLQQAMQQRPDRQGLGAIAIATGPEGGWTDEEIAAAIAAGYQPVSLGCRILRAVTAPLVALSLVAANLESRHTESHNNR